MKRSRVRIKGVPRRRRACVIGECLGRARRSTGAPCTFCVDSDEHRGQVVNVSVDLG